VSGSGSPDLKHDAMKVLKEQSQFPEDPHIHRKTKR
jgi:hypothetical protein